MIGWYIAPYKNIARTPGGNKTKRYCAMKDYKSSIWADGGTWGYTEVLGNRAIVKVRASEETLNILNGVFKRIPKDRLDDSLSDLPSGVKQALKNEAIDMGYTIAELQERFPNDLGTYTLKQFLKFLATRRLKPRYDPVTDTVIVDGIIQVCRPLEDVDAEVQ